MSHPPLVQLSADQRKWIKWFVNGALLSEFRGYPSMKRAFQVREETEEAVVRFLTGPESVGKIHPFQLEICLEAQKLFNPEPVGYVTCGDIDHTPEDTPPLFGSGAIQLGVQNLAQAKFWVDECTLRVRPVYVGAPINPRKEN